MISFIRASFRLFLFGVFTILFLIPMFFLFIFTGKNLRVALKVRKAFIKMLYFILGVRIEKTGDCHKALTAFYIGNHCSYIDPVIVLRDVEALPVAKAEVGSWPLIGFAIKATGVFYVKRENKQSRASTLEGMRKMVLEGFSILIYPEGTTHLGDKTLKFKKGAFFLAAQHNIPIVPVAIAYFDQKDAWISNESFLKHFYRAFGKRISRVKIKYGNPITSNDGEELLIKTQGWIDEQLPIIRSEIKQRLEAK